MKIREYIVPNEKHCSVCGELQPIANFSTEKRSVDGKSSACKKCVGAYQREWYKNNCEKQKKNSKDWKSQNPYKNHKNHIRAVYGVSESEYNSMFDAQKGCCAICLTHQSDMKRRLAVDHCHTHSHIRGLLCTNCNTALGMLKDNIQALERAVDYLRRFDRVP